MDAGVEAIMRGYIPFEVGVILVGGFATLSPLRKHASLTHIAGTCPQLPPADTKPVVPTPARPPPAPRLLVFQPQGPHRRRHSGPKGWRCTCACDCVLVFAKLQLGSVFSSDKT